MDYDFRDIKEAYKKLGIEKGRTACLRTDIRFLGGYGCMDKNEVLSAHFDTLAGLIDLSKGTIVVPTASMSLCETGACFDPDQTPSETGALTEYIRRQKGARRSMHPFISYSAIGKEAKAVCENVSMHAFGPETPVGRMIDGDVLEVSVGLHPTFTCTTVHHMEMIMGVPYRYTKEFIHPVRRDGRIQKETFYMYVWYRECNIVRDQNKKIFEHFLKSGFKIKETPLGRGRIYSYSLKEFYKSTIELFRDDIYAFLKEVPDIKPYRN